MEYRLYWLNGTTEVIGNPNRDLNISEAFAIAGYGGGAINALDVYHEGTDIKYEWANGKWTRIVT